MSPLRKCLPVTLKSNPRIDVSNPSRPVYTRSYFFRKAGLTGSPLINQLKFVAGFDRPELQLTLTVSPI